MPKTNKKFDRELDASNGELLDILTMSRSEAKEYHKKFPNLTLQEIMYNE